MFGRSRRRKRLRSRRHPELDSQTSSHATQEPWVALPLEGLVAGATPPLDAVEPPRPKPSPPPPPRHSQTYVLPLVALVAAATLFVFQSAVRTTLSEYWIADSSLASLERATSISAGNALGWFRLGLSQANEGRSTDAVESLRQAAALAPADSDSRIALGLELERARNWDQAERELLDAVSVDAGFKVRWSLANYYLRRGDWDEVWRWLHAAVLAEPSQLPVAAALGWRANAEPQTILDRAIPDRPDANRRYFGYLADIQQLDAMRQAWPRFAASLVAMDTPIANQYLDRLIAAGHVDEAVVAWNLMCDKVLLPHAPLGAEEGRYLTNPYFLTAPSSHGFDWHPGNHRGVSWSRLPTTANRGALEFRLSGAQDSGITLLRQVMPAVSGEYQLSFQLATQGMPTRTGVGWTVREAYGERVIYEFAGLNNAEGFWDDGNVSFHVPSDVPAVILEFRYETAEFGVIRRGAVQLRNLELVRASSAGAPLR